MLAPWIFYASAMGCLIAVVALLLERIARWRNRPTRWIWLAAVLAIVVLPIALNLLARAPTPVVQAAYTAKTSASLPSHSFDTPVLVLWLAGSLLLSARLIGTAVALHRRRDQWIAFDVDGSRVLIADELGPAVVGWTRFVTVIPRWAFALDERARVLMLRHESEHVRSGDPYLRTVAIAGLVLMPWNPAIWWSMRRLRLAVEVDCDRRLIVSGVDPHEYASLLLAVGERISATPFAWATALAGSRSSLETRILAMTSSLRPRHTKLAIAGVCTIAAALIAIACASPVPDPVVPPPAGIAMPLQLAKAARDSALRVVVQNPGTAKHLMYTKAVLDSVTRDSATRFRLAGCTVGSSCPGGPEGYVVFRKSLRGPCNADVECEKEVPSVTGDSIHLAGDTIYVYRAREGHQGVEASRVPFLNDQLARMQTTLDSGSRAAQQQQRLDSASRVAHARGRP